MNALEISGLSKSFAECRAVHGVDLSVRQGQIAALIGPSGCGKTTLLRLIAGFENPDRGSITVNGQQVAGEHVHLPAEARRVGMVFQDYALFPHLNVAQNVAFGLRADAQTKAARAQEMLALVGLGELGARMPHQLSGGQQQRIALARALAPRPAILLLDEPFSNLDAALRKMMREEVRRILQATGTTTVFVTHDQEEALSIADRVAVMNSGQIVQVGSPREVYLCPASREVATLVGETNFLSGSADGRQAICALGSIPLANHAIGPADVLIRPEMLHIAPDPDGVAEVIGIQFFGHDQIVKVRLNESLMLKARARAMVDLDVGQRVGVTVQGAVMAYPRT